MKTIVHLIRHAEVENPKNVWYGRLEGFHLSSRGRGQAEALADHLSTKPIVAVYTSPLERARQTADAIADRVGLVAKDEPDIIESETWLQGKFGDFRIFRNPLRLRYFINPLRPSWGEPYRKIAARMVGAIERMREAHAGGDVVAVSHMTPIVVARIWVEGKRIPAWASGVSCGRASVTSLEFDGAEHVATSYVDVGATV